MKYDQSLKKISSQTQSYWDRDEMPAAARQAFRRALQCRTEELGAEVYSSENHELILYHTCKSRACPSCGYRATVQWLRERWAALPDTLYKGITFTMPDSIWPFFRDNPHLAKALSALAAELIQARMSAKYGLRVGVIAILHTFNGRLEFNSHVHTMVEAMRQGCHARILTGRRSKTSRSEVPWARWFQDCGLNRPISAHSYCV